MIPQGFQEKTDIEIIKIIIITFLQINSNINFFAIPIQKLSSFFVSGISKAL